MIEPISSSHEHVVRATTADYIALASDIYKHNFRQIPVLFDLKGRAAGMYRVSNGNRAIRYNPYIFSKYFADNLQTTVPHEVSHYIVDVLYGAHRVRPHGPEWREIMLSLDAAPNATGSYDLTGIPVRRQQRYSYKCDCKTHQISTVRHNKIQHGKTVYYCRSCRKALSSLTSQ